MKKLLAFWFVIPFVGLLSALAAPPSALRSKSAPNKPKIAKPAPAVSVGRYSKVPFDKSTARITSDFRGHDLVSLFAALTSKFKPKGEFETTEAYNKRVEAAAAEPLLDGVLTARSTLSAVIRLSSGGEFSELKYDADAKLLAVRKSLAEVPYDLEDYDARSKQRAIPTGIDFEKILGTYAGRNAYGIRKRILQKDEYTCDLIMLNPKQFGFKTKSYDVLGREQDIDFDVAMDPATAEKVVRRLRLLVLFQIAQPFFGGSKDYHTPTIDDPLDLTVHKFYIYARVDEIWLYDSLTGEVYAKFTASGEA